MKASLRLAIGIAVSLACLVLAFRNVSIAELLKLGGSVPLQLVALYLGVTSVSLFLRGARWQILLTGAEPTSFVAVLAVNCAGQMGNAVLPARMGDLFRATNLNRSGISSGFSLATILVERILDAGFLVMTASIAVHQAKLIPPALLRASTIAGGAAVVGLVLALSLPLLEDPLRRVIQRVLPSRWQDRAKGLVEQFVTGLRSMHRAKIVLLFLVLTIAIWSMDGLGIWILARAASFSLSSPVIILLLTALALSSAIPAAPGNAGVYQIVAVTVLAPFGIGSAPALVFAVTWQALTIVNVLIWGLCGLWYLASRKLLVGFRKVSS